MIGDVPCWLCTVTTTVPLPGGVFVSITVLLCTVNEGAFVVPKLTPVIPVNPSPVIVTGVPPAAGPLEVLSPKTTGT